jgi:ribosomal protein S18 acetylase RimI-like enzyme
MKVVIDIRALTLRPATLADAPALAAIELEAFPDPSWTAADFLRYDCTVAQLDKTIAGFIVSRENCPGTTDAPPEREILNLAVARDFRRLGIASRLLRGELRRTANVFLEVRESNSAAIQLYKNAGFIEISRRRDYYDTPVESAIVMRMKW